MAEFAYTLEPKQPLGGLDLSIGENRILERSDLALVSIATPHGGEKVLAASLLDVWGLEMPTSQQSTKSGDLRALRIGPDQLMIIFPHSGPDANASIKSQLKDAGYTTDQTHAWVALEVSGPDTNLALERICPLDLSLRSFPNDAFGRTVMDHIGAIVIRIQDDRFFLLSASSLAVSYLHAVETSYRNVQG